MKIKRRMVGIVFIKSLVFEATGYQKSWGSTALFSRFCKKDKAVDTFDKLIFDLLDKMAGAGQKL